MDLLRLAASVHDSAPGDNRNWLNILLDRRPRKIRRSWQRGGWKVSLRYTSSDSAWGRFGGGWQWELGFQAGGGTLAINLLVATVTVSRRVPV